MLVDEPAIIAGIYHGAAGLAYGPVPVGPEDAVRARPTRSTRPIPYNPAKAVSILKAHGWHVVPNGQTTCANAGTGANQCGAGHPEGDADLVPVGDRDGSRRAIRAAHR